MNKVPGSGRKKGTPNKKTQEIAEKVASSGKDPVQVLLDLLDHENPGIVLTAAKELCQYLYPKRKAVEMSTKGFFRKAVQRLDGTLIEYTNEPKEDEDDES